MTQESEVLVERLDFVGVLTLNRPSALNALTNDLVARLADELERLDTDPSTRAIVITGGPRVFAAGADLRQLAAALGTPGGARSFLEARVAQWDRIRAIRAPLVAAVAGYALGAGCELAMCCDLIVAGESARFGQPELGVGLVPGAGGSQRLPRIVGKARAMEAVLLGRPFTAQEALANGLVNRVVPTELLRDEAIGLALALAAKPPLAVRAAKQAILQAFELPLRDGLEYEREALLAILETEDAREGISAFLEKRSPEFHGR